ncbi:MAG: MATE family efflux transporter [Clostridia bacterium]|nr:MATE family efflux transporter [Clostridia bacterium]
MKKPQIAITRDRDFYKQFFSVWSVLVLYNIITLGVNLADNIMVGAYSEDALSGVTSVNQIQFLFQQLLMGAGDAVVVLGSQYWGQKRTEPIKRFFMGALLFGVVLSLGLFVAACITPEGLLSLFTTSTAIKAEGVAYLRVMKYSYLIFALTALLLATLRSVETVRVGFWVSVSTLVVNISLNYLLIYGNFGFPALGTTGAAIATLSARIAEFVIVVVYVFAIDKKLRWRIRDFFTWDKPLVMDYFKLCRSFLFTSLIFGSSILLQTVILGHMNDSAIAANSVASTLFQMLKVASIGASSAASILIGKAIGEDTDLHIETSPSRDQQVISGNDTRYLGSGTVGGKMGKIRSYTQTLQLMFVGIGLITSALLFILRIPIVNLYTDLSPETRQMALDFILVLCVTGFGTAYQMPTATGIIRGGGDGKFVMVNDIISIWGIVIPLSFLAAFVFKWPPVAVVICLNSDQVFKCGAAFIKCNRYRWIKKLTR